jgi:TonB-linked SusC/RagA family outer membrane protein
MVHRMVPRWLLALTLALLFAGTAQAQTGRITGQVTDSANARPLDGVDVAVVSSSGRSLAGARTDMQGRFVLPSVAPGEAHIRVRALGYGPQDRVVTVAAGQATTADFALAARSVQLDQVVVTGTGGAVERRAVGNVIESINADSVAALAAPRDVGQLIGARTPGVIMLPSTGQVGTGSQIRVRSVGSLSLNNDPIVYIDGVRMDADPSNGPSQRGGAGASRLNDINPEDIESIEIIKGPAAATLYGTQASNGVVQIITKRGKTGAAHWDFTARDGANWLENPEDRAGMLFAKNASGGIDSVNLYKYAEENGIGPIFSTGRNHNYSANLSGGTDVTRYFLSSSVDRDVGVVPWNWDRKFGGRANLDVQPNAQLRINGSLGYIQSRVRLAQPGEINPDPFSNLVWGSPKFLNTPQAGFGFAPPSLWDDVQDHTDNDRATTSVTADYEPFSWFTHKLSIGLDQNSESDWALYPREDAADATYYGSNGLGNKSVTRTTSSFLTLDYAGNLKYSLRSVDFTTTVGFQHLRSEASSITATGNTFPASPITTVTGATGVHSGSEGYLANSSVGVYVQEQGAWRNRLFITAALRGDDNSAFGKNYSAAYYPKLSASWVVSEEPFWHDKLAPLGHVFDDLRLRAAYGAAGAQPGTFDAERLYAPTTGYQNQPGLIPSSYGNPDLKPERSAELEMGFESNMFDQRLDLSYTNFSRRITDAIVNVPVAPSLGFPGSQVVNIGKVKGWGNEFSGNLHILRGRRVAWDFGTQLANNGNRILDMGGQQFLTVGGGGQAQNRVGFGIGDLFMYKVRSAVLDATGKVLSAICDGGTGPSGLMPGGPDAPCPVGTFTGTPAPRVYWGHSQPTWQMGFNTQVTLWQNLRLYARVDGDGGNLQEDTEIRALANQGSTKAVILGNDPLLQTYRAIEADGPSTYKAGFMRLREVSASYTISPRYVQRLRASGASVTLAGRNLSMLWTAQNGWNTARDGEVFVDIANQHVWDPEIRAVGALSNGYQTVLPPTASVVASFRLTY